MADQEHRLGRGRELPLEPALARDVEVVVGLVEQQRGERPAPQQRLEDEPLLLAAGQRADLAPLDLVIRLLDGGDAAFVPVDFLVVAARFRVVVERPRVAELGGLVVALHHRELGVVEAVRGGLNPRRRDGKQQVADGGAVRLRAADELAHHADRAADADCALGCLDVACQHAQQGGLARAVRADDRGGCPVGDLEGRVVEQLPAIRQHVADVRHLDVSHQPDGTRRRVRVATRLSGGHSLRARCPGHGGRRGTATVTRGRLALQRRPRRGEGGRRLDLAAAVSGRDRGTVEQHVHGVALRLAAR